MNYFDAAAKILLERSCLAGRQLNGYVLFYRDLSEGDFFVFSFDLHGGEELEMRAVRKCISNHLVDAMSSTDPKAESPFQGGIGCVVDGELRISALSHEQLSRLF